MSPRLLGLAAAATAALVALASADREAPPPAPAATPAPPQASDGAGRRTPGAEPVAALDAAGAFASRPMPRGRDAFGARSWAPPPPKPAPPPPKPTAPALPFVYLGRMDDAGTPRVILRRGKQVLVAGEKASIDAQYRLEEIAPQGLVFTYLPLNEQQTLAYAK